MSNQTLQIEIFEEKKDGKIVPIIAAVDKELGDEITRLRQEREIRAIPRKEGVPPGCYFRGELI